LHQWQSCPLRRAWPTNQCLQLPEHISSHLYQRCRLMHCVNLKIQQKKHVGSLNSRWL
jgi:hypothetical protein